MREIRPSGSEEGVMSNHDPYSDSETKRQQVMRWGGWVGRCGGLSRKPGFVARRQAAI